jgi:hypothetical protein
MDCSKVVTVPQFSGTCWFNAVMMTLFYSEGMRRLIMSKVAAWETKKVSKPKRIIKELVTRKYVHMNNEHMAFFRKIKPEVLLAELHEEDAEMFEFNPKEHTGGFNTARYLHKVLKYVGVTDIVILDAVVTPEKTYNVFLSKNNKYTFRKDNIKLIQYLKLSKEEVQEHLQQTPEVLVFITKSESTKYTTYYYKTQMRFDPIISYNGVEYIADSMKLGNFNKDVCHFGHAICGVTCNGHRFMYNGWINESVDPGIKQKMYDNVPCALMPYDWLDKNAKSFCLDDNKCKLLFKTRMDDVCFNVHMGPRVYIYIRSDVFGRSVPKVPLQSVACPPGKFRNPLTGRCINESKKCPTGKVFNTETGRCNKKKEI